MAEPWSDGDVPTATELAGLPWGVVGYVNGSTSDQTGISSDTDITGLSVTFTAVSSRLYLAIMSVEVLQVSSGGSPTIYLANGSDTALSTRQNTLGSNERGEVTVMYLVTGASGSTTIKGRALTSAGTVTVVGSSTRRPRLIVLDVGAG